MAHPAFPRSLAEFQAWFASDEACRRYLVACRWPDGFRSPPCGDGGSYLLATRDLLQCRACRRQTSVTAGTVLDRTRLPLPLWFAAAYLVATHTPGFSALQLQRQLGLARYRRRGRCCTSCAAPWCGPSATGFQARWSWTRPMSGEWRKGGAVAGSATARRRSWPVPWRSAATAPAGSGCPTMSTSSCSASTDAATPMAAFQSLLGLTTQHAPTTYQMLYAAEPTG